MNWAFGVSGEMDMDSRNLGIHPATNTPQQFSLGTTLGDGIGILGGIAISSPLVIPGWSYVSLVKVDEQIESVLSKQR